MVAVDPSNIQVMVDWPTPKTIQELRGFLGLTGYYRKFVKHYGKISEPLTSFLRKDSFKWDSIADSAFAKLKRAMSSIPVLALPDFQKLFVSLECDASGIGIGTVLQQEGHPLAFTSKDLSPLHQQMSAYDKEMMAIVHAVTKLRPYLIGRRFQIKTDHKSIKYILEQRVSSIEQQRWVSKLMGYDYEIIYKKGVENVVADALSRLPGQAELSALSVPLFVGLNEIKEEVATDKEMQELIHKLQSEPMCFVITHGMGQILDTKFALCWILVQPRNHLSSMSFMLHHQLAIRVTSELTSGCLVLFTGRGCEKRSTICSRMRYMPEKQV